MRTIAKRWTPLGAIVLVCLLHVFGMAATPVLHMTNSVHGAGWYEYLLEMADRFHALHPDIEVEILRTSGYNDRFGTMLAGGTPPDVTDFTPSPGAPFVEAGAFKDMRELMDTDPLFSREDLLQVTFQALTLADGFVWAFPIDIYPLVTYYNGDILAKAGLQEPNSMSLDDWDWDQVVAYGKKTTLQSPDGRVVQYGIDRPNQRWITVLNQAGGGPYDRMIFPTESGWDNPAVHEGMEWLRSLFVDHRIAAPYGSGEASNFYFWLGDTAMHLAYGPGMIGGGYEDLGFGWDVTRPPKGPAHRGSMFTVNAFQIAAQSAHPEAAWEWVKFIAYNEESLGRFVQLTNRVPALAAMQPVYASLADNAPRSWHQFYETAMDPDIVPAPMDPSGSRVDEVVFAGFRKIFSGEQATGAVLTDVHRQVTAILDEAAAGGLTALTTRLTVPTDASQGTVVFQSDRTGSWQLFKMNMATGAVTQLTTLGQNYQPRVSPDGTRIAFDSSREGDRAVFVMDIDGGNQQRLVQGLTDARNATWSPDGTAVAFHARVPEGGWAIHTVRADGTDLQRITFSDGATDAWVSWSPDGAELVYSSNRAPHGPNYQTFAVNVDGTNDRLFITSERRSQRPVWSPDGAHVVVGSNRDGRWEIYIDAVDGSGSVRLTDDDRTDLEPSWSPDGTQVIYSGENSDGTTGIYIVNADGTGGRQLDVGPGNNQYAWWVK